MLHSLFQHSLRFDRIVRYDEQFVTRLLVDDGQVRGVAALDIRDGVVRCIRARAVILCTGGAGKIFSVLAEQEINIDLISSSNLVITCVVPEKDLARGAIALHEALIETDDS